MALLLGLLLLVQADTALPADVTVLAGRVTRVIDGDTLDVLLATGRIRVRLHGVDAPEHDQPGGAQAMQWLKQRVEGRDVLLEPISQDRYERMVAVVHLGDIDVNRDLVRSGNAWAYRQYLRARDRALCDIEAEARTEGRGLWSAARPRAPWEYRSTRGQGPFTPVDAGAMKDCHDAIPIRRAPR
jgi:micrococcal nuclease